MSSSRRSTPTTTAVGPLDGLSLRDRLDLAARLAGRLAAHVLRPANAAAVERLVGYVRSESLVPAGEVDPERYAAVTRDCATDLLVHAGPREERGSLVRRLLAEGSWGAVHGPGVEDEDDGTDPAGLVLNAAERALLEQWHDGGVLGHFIVTDLVDEHAVLHNLEDDLDYRVFTGRSEIRAVALVPGLPLSGRVLPVGAVWVFASTPAVFLPEAIEGVVHGVVALLTSSPSPAFRNPRTLARARELVADHHRAFLDLFGDVVVEGTASHVVDCCLRFKDRVGAPAEEFALLGALRDERWLPDDAADPDDATFALVHHPVKGLRLLDWYAQLREVHTAPLLPWKPRRLAQVLADPDAPSWVLALLAERHPDHLDVLYREASGRPGLTWARDGAALLRDREPAPGRDEPGIVMAASIMGRVPPPGWS